MIADDADEWRSVPIAPVIDGNAWLQAELDDGCDRIHDSGWSEVPTAKIDDLHDWNLAVHRPIMPSTEIGPVDSKCSSDLRDSASRSSALAADISEYMACTGRVIHGLSEFLKELRLHEYAELANKWAVDMGAAWLEEIVENGIEFSDALRLKPLERKRLLQYGVEISRRLGQRRPSCMFVSSSNDDQINVAPYFNVHSEIPSDSYESGLSGVHHSSENWNDVSSTSAQRQSQIRIVLPRVVIGRVLGKRGRNLLELRSVNGISSISLDSSSSELTIDGYLQDAIAKVASRIVKQIHFVIGAFEKFEKNHRVLILPFFHADQTNLSLTRVANLRLPVALPEPELVPGRIYYALQSSVPFDDSIPKYLYFRWDATRLNDEPSTSIGFIREGYSEALDEILKTLPELPENTRLRVEARFGCLLFAHPPVEMLTRCDIPFESFSKLKFHRDVELQFFPSIRHDVASRFRLKLISLGFAEAPPEDLTVIHVVDCYTQRRLSITLSHDGAMEISKCHGGQNTHFTCEMSNPVDDLGVRVVVRSYTDAQPDAEIFKIRDAFRNNQLECDISDSRFQVDSIRKKTKFRYTNRTLKVVVEQVHQTDVGALAMDRWEIEVRSRNLKDAIRCTASSSANSEERNKAMSLFHAFFKDAVSLGTLLSESFDRKAAEREHSADRFDDLASQKSEQNLLHLLACDFSLFLHMADAAFPAVRRPTPSVLAQLEDGRCHHLDPFMLGFAHDSISSSFREGLRIDSAVEDVVVRRLDPSDFPELEVVLIDGNLVAINGNRRLFLFRVLAALGEVCSVPVKLLSLDHSSMQKVRWDARLGYDAPKWERAWSSVNAGRWVDVRSRYYFWQCGLLVCSKESAVEFVLAQQRIRQPNQRHV